MMAEQGATFKESTVAKLIQHHLGDAKPRVNNEAQQLTTELLRVFVMEGAVRAKKRAQEEGSSVVTIEHFEKVLPQLLLDF